MVSKRQPAPRAVPEILDFVACGFAPEDAARAESVRDDDLDLLSQLNRAAVKGMFAFFSWYHLPDRPAVAARPLSPPVHVPDHVTARPRRRAAGKARRWVPTPGKVIVHQRAARA